jgi:hypothetical protein
MRLSPTGRRSVAERSRRPVGRHRPRRVVAVRRQDPRRVEVLAGRENAIIMAVLLLIIGVKLIGNAISGFSD